MKPTRRALVVGGVVGALVVGLGAVGVSSAIGDRGQVTASSTARGYSVDGLLDSGPPASDDARWRSADEAEGAWIDIEWDSPVTVGAIEVTSADGSASFTSAALTFDGQDSMLITADGDGVAATEFPERRISSLRFTVSAVPAGVDSVALAGIAVESPNGGDAPAAGAGVPPAVASSSSSADDTDPAALTDGDTAAGDLGAEWSASPDDDEPWVQLTWPTPVILAGVNVFGPSAASFDPRASAAQPLFGRLVFDDGSEVEVSGIAGASDRPTTVAFMPRTASSVRIRLAKSIDTAPVALREVIATERGSSPIVLDPETDAGYAVSPPAASCAGRVPTAGSTADLTLLCPAPGSSISGDTTLQVSAMPGSTVTATGRTRFADEPSYGVSSVLATAVADADGVAVVVFDADELQAGPLTVLVSSDEDGEDSYPLHVQLVNAGGSSVSADGYAPQGMTLQWEDQFRAPVSVSRTGEDAVYAAGKPEDWGISEFGDAAFTDPADGGENLATIADEYLRIRVDSTRPDGDDGKRYSSGAISSLTPGGAGFSAQYGYFEARMMGAPGEGTWPAFWMLDSEDATNRGDTSGEVDAVELYGHNTTGSCHSIHNWIGEEDVDDVVDCADDNGFDDWTTSWHTYGARVMPDSVIFYIDGVEVSRAEGLKSQERPYYFMLNLALGGGWPVDLEPTGGTSDLYVDWVRVYT